MANKCAIASRIDCFSEYPTAKIGEALRDQVEERLKFVASGTKPRKNKEAMEEVLAELKQEGLFYGDNPKKVEGAAANDDADEDDTDEERAAKKKAKKEKKEKKAKKDEKEEKKSKKRKRSEVQEDSDDEDEAALKEAAKIKKKKKTK